MRRTDAASVLEGLATQARPAIMGILNVTPDSFSDGGRFLDHAAAVAHGHAMRAGGADVIDVGGESTRPGAAGVPVSEELGRVLPVIETLAGDGVTISIDTRREEVARAAVDAGAVLINDVSATLAPVAAELGVGWIAMHMQGEPRSMQRSPRYDDVRAEVAAHLVERATAARDAGVPQVWIDPGFGFGKTFDHNLDLLAHLDELADCGFPVAVGLSRKSTLGELTRRSDGTDEPAPLDDRLEGSVATATYAMLCGARMVRVHDVKATRQAAAVVSSTPQGPWPAVSEQDQTAS
ncbi:MAG: dihydropteroate synthase [Acidimicrobiales bacterium]